MFQQYNNTILVLLVRISFLLKEFWTLLIEEFWIFPDSYSRPSCALLCIIDKIPGVMTQIVKRAHPRKKRNS